MRDMYNKIKLTSRRWTWILAVKESALLPKINHFDILKLFGQPFKGKINIITRELSTISRAFFGLTYQLSCCIGDKKWKSSWLVLTTQLNHWYIINKIFWKNLFWIVKKKNQHNFQYQVITFNYYVMTVAIGLFYSVEVEESKYAIVYMLTLHSSLKNAKSLFSIRSKKMESLLSSRSSSKMDRWLQLRSFWFGFCRYFT